MLLVLVVVSGVHLVTKKYEKSVGKFNEKIYIPWVRLVAFCDFPRNRSPYLY